MLIDHCSDGGTIDRTDRITQILWNALTDSYVTSIFVLFTVSIADPDRPFIAFLKLFRVTKDPRVFYLY